MKKTTTTIPILILFALIIHCTSDLDYKWSDLKVNLIRTYSTSEKTYYEKIDKNDLNKIPIILQKIYKEKSPYPLEIISAKWKFIESFEKDSTNFGFQIRYRNKIDSDLVGMMISSTQISLYDQDDFIVKSFSQKSTSGIPIDYLFVEQGDILKSQFKLKT